VSAYIYIEAARSELVSKYLKTKCQEAFHKLLERMGFNSASRDWCLRRSGRRL